MAKAVDDSGRDSAPVRPAFTLIELLVVVAIIAVLIAILLPSLGQAKQQAKSVQCRSNLRQLAMGVCVYADTNSNRMVPYELPPTPASGGTVIYWPQSIYDRPQTNLAQTNTLSSVKQWICPSFPRDLSLGTSTNAADYGINFDHVAGFVWSSATSPAPTTPPKIITSLQNPSTLLLIADTEDSVPLHTQYGTSSFAAGFLRTYCPIEQGALSTAAGKYLATTGGVDIRHLNKANIAFLDTHVETRERTQIVPDVDDLFGHNR